MTVTLSKEKQYVTNWIDSNKGGLLKLSEVIWSYAELGMEEFRSSKAITDYLKGNGFEVETGVADMPTAFVATFGDGKPLIGFSCEYDALPGLSQEKAVNDERPIIPGAPGHGCGHNLLGVAAITAVVALKEAMSALNLPGTIKLFGTPAEELCIGKPYMARAGLFNGIDAIIDWHPGAFNRANYTTCNAYSSIRYHFRGRTAHGNSPWYGRSALDAALIMGNMIEHLREHTTPGDPPYAANTINYSFPDVGPAFPVVVPNTATLWCVSRIVTSKEMEYIIGRVQKCAQAAAMATETTVEVEMISATHERIPNKVICQVLYDNLQAIGAPEFTEAEHSFARKMQKDFGAAETGLSTSVSPFSGGSSGVSDNAEYSWFAPFGALGVACSPDGVGTHNWRVNACAGSTIGEKAMDVAAKALATSGIDLLTQPGVIAEARKEFNERLEGRVFESLIPETVKPPVQINREIMDKYRPLQEKYYQEP